MSDVIIRRAQVSDAEQIQRVYAHIGTFSGTLQLPHPSVETWQERLRKLGDNDFILVAEDDGNVVATAGLHLQPRIRRRHVASLGIGVADTHTGRGIGTRLMRELLHIADNWMGLLRLELEVFTDNAAALTLYRKFGFEIEGTHRGHAFRNGVYVDSHSMARLHPTLWPGGKLS